MLHKVLVLWQILLAHFDQPTQVIGKVFVRNVRQVNSMAIDFGDLVDLTCRSLDNLGNYHFNFILVHFTDRFENQFSSTLFYLGFK